MFSAQTATTGAGPGATTAISAAPAAAVRKVGEGGRRSS